MFGEYMRPYDCLTENDKEIVRQWCINYANAEPQSIEQILSTWNKNKRTLFRAFGKQLRISFPIHQKVNSSYRKNKWRSLYSPVLIYDKADLSNFKYDPRNHVFINNLILWLQKEWVNKLPIETLKDIIEYTKYCYIENGKTNEDKVFINRDSTDKILKIPAGTKIMRAIRKVLEYYGFPYINSFNKWRDDISVINTDKEINAELVFSINPVDFITMSDNKSGWTSCMSWIDHGSYSTGTIEMMNSNLAIVVYLQNPQSFIYNDIEIPNKSWRTLAFIHKDLLLVGKHYPYQSEMLAKIILDKLQDIIKQNLGWKYQYKNQLYKDMIHSYSNDYIRGSFQRWSCGHKIYTYTNIMYPDIIEDHSTDYWCCRNYVNKNLYLNLSGPATCMCCGKIIDKYKTNDISSFKKYCLDCERDYQCAGCDLISVTHARERINFIENTYWGKIHKQGCFDGIFDRYWWDTIEECCVSKIKVRYWIDNQDQNQNRYRPVTRERLC
jgi:hypothetical protein